MTEGKCPTILNVNDTEANRYALGRTLERAGFHLLEASDGNEALQTVADRRGEIDLVLLDVNLPDISGLEVCRQIKANPATALIPVLHISASATESHDRVHGLDSGADGYLSQSVKPQELIATVNALLRLRTAKRALRDSEELYRSLAESIPQLVWTAGPDGAPASFNGRWYDFTGLGREVPFDTAWPGVIHPEDAEEDSERRRLAVTTGSPYENAVRLKRAIDGVYQWHLGRAVPVRGDTGEIIRWFGTYTNVDEQEKARLDLEHGERRKNEFLAMLGHELRNPLAPLTTAVEILRELGDNPAAVARQASVIDRQVRQMVRLVDDLLDVARISRGRIEIKIAPLSFNAVVEHALDGCSPFRIQRQHRLIRSISDEPLIINADAVRLQQVVGNLLHNAIKYTNPGGKIWVSLERDGTEAVLQVRDSGIGILPETLPHVFDTFVQAERSLDRSQGGLGIGLTLVKQLVELHQGTVVARSAGADQGSEFIVRLPLIPMADVSVSPGIPQTDPSGAGDAPLSSAAVRRSVLIVEDNLDAAESLAELLDLWGHEVMVAHDGQKALEIARLNAPDMMLVDIGLPLMDGYELARRFRETPALKPTRLVAMTGYGRDEDRRLAMLAGFDIHMTKPIDPDTLRRLLSAG